MTWKMAHSAAENLLLVESNGVTTTDDVLAQISEGIHWIKEHEIPGALVDYSDAVLELSFSDLFKLPDLFTLGEVPRNTKMALLVPTDEMHIDKYTFFDDVANNRGYMVKLFTQREAAMAWLTAES